MVPDLELGTDEDYEINDRAGLMCNEYDLF